MLICGRLFGLSCFSMTNKAKNNRTNQGSKPGRPTHASENQGSHLTNKACKAQTGKVMYVVLAQKVSSYK
jgi:hypothetical protein